MRRRFGQVMRWAAAVWAGLAVATAGPVLGQRGADEHRPAAAPQVAQVRVPESRPTDPRPADAKPADPRQPETRGPQPFRQILVQPAVPVPPGVQVPPSAEAMRFSFAPVAKAAMPAVVTVHATKEARRRPARTPFDNDPLFRRFFGDFDLDGGGRANSVGSGVIVDPSGIIITNGHVIADSDTVKVSTADGQEMKAEVLLVDRGSDLAVLRVASRDPLPHLDLADSDRLEVGDLVLAIGNPFGVGQTVTSGIVSALSRTGVGSESRQFFIQTDAPINPGNSGGALVDMSGRLAGINTAIFSKSGGSDGVGFAVPSNMVKVVLASAKEGGPVRRPWLGATTQALTPELASRLGLSRARGALVASLVEDGPAAKAGVRVGDLIVAVDGVEVNDPDALDYRLATRGIGNRSKLDVYRAGRRQEVEVALAAPPRRGPREAMSVDGRSPFAGATIANLSPELVDELARNGARDLPDTGVVIIGIAQGSRADRLGLRPGDVLIDVNGVPIDTADRLAAVAAQPIRMWQFRIAREGRVLRSIYGG